MCDRCGVEVTEKKVRRERIGHISLVVPVAHIWYFRTLPNKIGYLLGLPSKKLDMIIYYERYVVINTPEGILNTEGEAVKYLDFLSEEEYLDILDAQPIENQYLSDDDPQKFVAKMGAEAIQSLLAKLNLDNSKNIVSLSINSATLSLAVNLPLLCCFPTATSPPPNSISLDNFDRADRLNLRTFPHHER